MTGALATPHGEATRAGLDAYRAGGNAIDAALAAAAVLAVVYPHQCSAGGDLFAVVSGPDGRAWAVNGSGAAPAGTDPERLRARFAEMPDWGVEPITVPGAVAAWEEIARLGGSLSLAAAIEPAAALAEEGFPVSRGLAAGIRSRLEPMLRDPGLTEVFTVEGVPLVEGEIVRQPALGRTLRSIARSGAAVLYGGEVGADLVRGLSELGSPIALADLAAHATLVDSPLVLELGGLRLLTAPPNCQGFVLLSMLAALGPGALAPSGAPVGLVGLSALLGMTDRDRWLGDPARPGPPLAALLDPVEAPARLRSFVRDGGLADRPARGDTVAVVAMDDDGWAISLIQSVFQTFGAAVLERSTGIVCQNRGRGFSLRAGAPNEIAPGARPAHTLVPLLVAAGSRVVAALGTMGGRAQPQILAQILPGALDPSRPLEETLAAPRWVIGQRDLGFEEATVAIEDGAASEAPAELAVTGLPVTRIPRFDERSGHAHVVRRGYSGLEAACDVRSDGSAGTIDVARPPTSGNQP